MKYGLLRVESDELVYLHSSDFESKEAAIAHAKHHKIQFQYPNYRWYVVPMDEVVIADAD